MASSLIRLIPVALTASLALCACDPADRPAVPAASISPVSSLEITDTKAGEGPAITAGQMAVVEYTGWLYETAAPDHKGKQFDSSVGRAPFRFKLGAGDVIPGWDQGVVGMKAGGERRLSVPPDLAYGNAGAGDGAIPPGAALVFDVRLLRIEPAAQ
jgi:FKBP-type peptidyl-prolyl cis-trans isomerase FkpA